MSASDIRRPSPYQGLIPYEEADAPFFFGREKETRLIIANLFASPLTLLYGASGVGKSSALRAGVANQLRGREELLVLVFNAWQSNPVADLKNKIAEKAGSLDPRFVPPTDSANLGEYLAKCAERLDRRLMIILDQFEEYFLYHPKEDEFVTEFSRAVTQSGSPVSFLISIREDFYAKLDRFEGRIPTLYDNYLRIEHLDRRAARVAIEKPIAEYNRAYTTDGQFSIEPELVDAVLRQVETGRVIIGEAGRGVVETAESAEGAARIETPFLQLVMTRLWEQEQKQGSHELRSKTLHALGGAENIVRTHLDAVITKLSDREQEIAARIFHYLVTPSGTKIAYTASDLARQAELEEAEVVGLLKRLSFGDVRILRTVEPSPDRPTSPRYEIFHDVLAPAILAWRTAYVQKQEKAKAERQLAVEAEQREKAVRQLEREQGLARRLRFALAGMALLLVLMFAVTGYAFYQRREAKKSQASAEQARDAARRAENEAIKEKGYAIIAKNDAELAEKNAEIAKVAAEEAKVDAQNQRAAALTAAEKEADQRKKTETALATAKKALEDRDIADKARSEAELRRQRVEDINMLRSEAERAKHPLETRPNESLRRAKAVLDNLRQRGIDDPVTSNVAEDVFRRSLLALEESNTKKILTGHADSVEGAYVSPDGELLVTTDAEGVAKIWNTKDWSEVNSLPHGAPIKKVVFNRDGSYFLTVSIENEVLIWNKDSLYSPVIGIPAEEATFGADGETVFLLDKGGDVSTWKLGTGAPVEVPRPWPAPVVRATVRNETWINFDGTLALTATNVGNDWTARVWQLGATRPPLSLAVDEKETLRRVAFSRDSKYVAVFDRERVLVFDISSWRNQPLKPPTVEAQPSPSPAPEEEPKQTPQPAITLPIPGKGTLMRMEFDPKDSNKLLTLNADGTTLLWTINSKESVQVLKEQNADTINVLFSPDREYVVLLGSGGTARVWNIKRQAVFATLRGHEGPVLSAAFSPRDNSLITTSYDKQARVWEWQPKTWRVTPRILGERETGLRAALSTDGRFVLATNGGANKWPMDGGEPQRFDGNEPTFSADGKWVAVADEEPLPQLSDLKAQSKRDLKGHTDKVTSAVFSKDGRYLLTASADKTARVWDLEKDTSIVLSGHNNRLAAAGFSADGQTIVTVGKDTRVWNWQTEQGRSQPTVTEIPYDPKIAAISPDTHFVATSPATAFLDLWDLRARKSVTRMRTSSGRINTIDFSRNGQRLLVVHDYGVTLLNLGADLPRSSLGIELADKTKGTEWTSALPARGGAFSPDGRFVLTGGGRLAQLWDVSAATPRRIASTKIQKGRIVGVGYSPSGRYIAVAINDGNVGTVHLWKTPQAESTAFGEAVAILEGMPVDRSFYGVHRFSFSTDEKFVMASDGEVQSAIWEWQSATGKQNPTIVPGSLSALSPDAQRVFTSRQTDVIRVQEASAAPQGKPLVIKGIGGTIRHLTLSPDGSMAAASIITRGDENFGELKVWNAKTGEPRGAALFAEEAVTRITFSPNNVLVAAASKNRLLLINTATQQEVPFGTQALDEVGLHKDRINDVEFSPDSKYVVTASQDKTARVWDVAAGKAVLLLRGHFGPVSSVSFSNNGKFIVTTSHDKKALVWTWTPPDAVGQLAHPSRDPVLLDGHTGSVLAAAFDRDSRFVVTGSADNSARIWNAHTGHLLAELLGSIADVRTVQFSPDGKSILAVGADGSARVYACPECAPLPELLEKAGNLTRQ